MKGAVFLYLRWWVFFWKGKKVWVSSWISPAIWCYVDKWFDSISLLSNFFKSHIFLQDGQHRQPPSGGRKHQQLADDSARLHREASGEPKNRENGWRALPELEDHPPLQKLFRGSGLRQDDRLRQPEIRRLRRDGQRPSVRWTNTGKTLMWWLQKMWFTSSSNLVAATIVRMTKGLSYIFGYNKQTTLCQVTLAETYHPCPSYFVRKVSATVLG